MKRIVTGVKCIYTNTFFVKTISNLLADRSQILAFFFCFF
nr:MAG TPA: hypothetical protein [Caudoviricetes sp.]